MTRRRWIALAAVALVLVIAASAGVVVLRRADLAQVVITRIEQRSGLKLVAARSTVVFGPHLMLKLDNPVVLDHGREVMRLRRLNLAFSYRAITQSDALPLYSIVLDGPRLQTPVRTEQVT